MEKRKTEDVELEMIKVEEGAEIGMQGQEWPAIKVEVQEGPGVDKKRRR